MGTPLSPEAADQAVRDQLGEQAVNVQGDSTAAGVYGNPANVSHPPQQMDLAAAKAVAVDAQALLERIQELEAKQAAAELAANPPPEPPDNTLRVDSSAPGYLHAVIAKIEARLSAGGL